MDSNASAVAAGNTGSTWLSVDTHNREIIEDPATARSSRAYSLPLRLSRTYVALRAGTGQHRPMADLVRA
jgi:hypothetical protein